MVYRPGAKTDLSGVGSGIVPAAKAKAAKVEKKPVAVPSEALKKPVADGGTPLRFLNGLYKWMEEVYHRSHEARSPGIHASQLAYVCGRREMLMAALKINPVPEKISAGGLLTTDEGHALHAKWQDDYLGAWGVLLGRWECLRCGHIMGTTADPIGRPYRCASCLGSGHEDRSRVPRIIYHEMRLGIPELGIVGATDGIVEFDGVRMVVEIKTKSPASFALIHGPEFGHLIQVHAYMAALGLTWTLFIYIQRGKQANWSRKDGAWEASRPTAKSYLVEFDEALWERVTRLVKDLTQARELLDSGSSLYFLHEEVATRMKRACDSDICDLAKACPVRERCFSLIEV